MQMFQNLKQTIQNKVIAAVMEKVKVRREDAASK